MAEQAKKFVTRKFPKELLLDIIWDGAKKLGFTRLSSEIVDQRRWVTVKACIFREDTTGKVYETTYETGSTEMQDTSPYEYEEDEIDCTEMHEVEVMVKQLFAVEASE